MPLDDETFELYCKIVGSDRRARRNAQQDLFDRSESYRRAIYPWIIGGSVITGGFPVAGIASVSIGLWHAIRSIDEHLWSEKLEPEYSHDALLCFDPDLVLVTMREDPEGYQIVRDARHFTDGSTLDLRPALITDARIERIGEENWISVADRGFRTVSPAGTYEWMIVECEGRRLSAIKAAEPRI